MQGGESGGGSGRESAAAKELGSAAGRGPKRRLNGDGGETSAAGEVLRHRANHVDRLPPDMHEQILALLPLDEAVRTSVLSPAWRDAVQRRLEGHSIQVVFNTRDAQEKITRLEEQPAGQLKCFSLVVDHTINTDDAKHVRRFLSGAAKCTVENLYVHLCSQTARNRVTFFFGYLNPVLHSLTLRGVTFSGQSFGWGAPPFANLTSIHLNSVSVKDNYLLGMLSMCPALRVLKLLYCRSLRVVTIKAPNLQHFTVAGCYNIKRMVLNDATGLRSYHYSGLHDSFFIPPGADMLTDLYICSGTTPMPGKVSDEWTRFSRNTLPSLSNITVLSICSNTLKIVSSLCGAGAKAELVILNDFRSLRELQLLMYNLEAVDLDNIYVFLRTCHCPNLTELFVQLPAPINWPFGEDLPGEQQEEQPEVGLDNLEVAKIMNFNWRHYELQLVAFLLRKASSNHRLLLVSPKFLEFDELGLQQEDLCLIQAARASGQLVVVGILDNHAHVYRPIHSKIYKF